MSNDETVCAVGDCIQGFGSEIMISRTLPGCYDEHGRWVEGASSVFCVVAAVQPAKPHEVLKLPEGRRTAGTIKVYTQTKLLTADVTTRQQPDRICWEGQEYEVLAVDYWTTGGYFKALAVEVGQ